MTDGNNNHGGSTNYVTEGEFNKYCEQNEAAHKRISNAMWGNEGTNGMIKDIHDLKMWIKFLGIIGGIISPILTAVLFKYLFGGV